MSLIEVTSIRKTYGKGDSEYLAISDVSLSAEPGEFISIVGPSGCGKTTLLRCLSGLMPTTSGSVSLHGRTVTGPPDEMALVFQEYNRSLFPWMSVSHNVELPLKKRIKSKAERQSAVEEALSAVGLGNFGHRYPWQLSGGMQQRVAIARAIAYRPEILLMDEPFASLDAQTRADLEDLLLKIRNEYNVTVLFVTHDIDEAVYLADRIVLLSAPPCVVKETIHVDLPRPRKQIATKEHPEFARLRGYVYKSIKGEN
jgi:NitT/TauT family transport system ATP-binding protein